MLAPLEGEDLEVGTVAFALLMIEAYVRKAPDFDQVKQSCQVLLKAFLEQHPFD
jgi:hypothetical protein